MTTETEEKAISKTELRKLLTGKKFVIGSDITLKNLKNGSVKKIFYASNCPQRIKDDLLYYAQLYNIEIHELTENNEALRIILKKPFKINVLSFSP